MGLLQDIQRELLEPSSEIGPTLLKLRYLASKLGSDALEDWVKHETEGYPDDVEVPDYRIAEVHYSGTFSNGFTTIKNTQVPSATIRQVAGDKWLRYAIRDSIAVIDKLVGAEAERENGNLGIATGDLAPLLNNRVFEGMGTISLRATFGGAPFSHAHSTVRARILDLTIELEKQIPIASTIVIGTPANEVSKSDAGAAAQITQTIIYGNQTNISNTASHGGSITTNVIAGDQASLAAHLVSRGVPEEAARQLAAIAEEEPPSDPQKPLGPKAKKWLGKVAGGAWDVSKDVGSAILVEALKAYYGLGG